MTSCLLGVARREGKEREGREWKGGDERGFEVEAKRRGRRKRRREKGGVSGNGQGRMRRLAKSCKSVTWLAIPNASAFFIFEGSSWGNGDLYSAAQINCKCFGSIITLLLLE